MRTRRLVSTLGVIALAAALVAVAPQAATAAPAPVTVSYTGPAVPILDNATVSAPVTVAGLGGLITELTVSLDGADCSTGVSSGIEHTFLGDLDVSLEAPDGTTVLLANRVGGSGDNFCQTTFDDAAVASIVAGSAPFAGSFQPANALSGFDGRNPNGVWSLVVADRAGADIGNIRAFSLHITAQDPTPTLSLQIAGPDGVFVPVASGAQLAVASTSATTARWTLTNPTSSALTGFYLYSYGPTCAADSLTIAAGASYVCTESIPASASIGLNAVGALAGFANPVTTADWPLAFPLSINIVDDAAAASLSLSTTSLVPGQNLTLSGVGFLPDDVLTAVIDPAGSAANFGPITVANGRFGSTLALPASITLGAHSVSLFSNGVFFGSRSFTVVAAGPEGAGPDVAGKVLPATGGDAAGIAAGSATLLLAGLGLMLLGRRRATVRASA